MVLRNRDSRRLRVILDESSDAEFEPSSTAATSQTGNAGESERARKPKRLYGYGAERRSQPKTTDLIPKRWPAYSSVVILLLGTIAILNAMAFYATSLKPYIGDAGVAAVSLQGSGTLASWFTTALMAAGSAVCLQVYYLRKHRCDDYRGSYRLWFWAGTLFLLGSIAGTVSVGQIALHLFIAMAGPLPMIGVVPVLIIVACVFLAALTMLGLWETRVSRGAAALIVVSWLAGTLSVLSTVPQVENALAQASMDPMTANAWLVFATCSFLAVLTYARHVYLTANGMLAVRPVSTKPVKAVATKKATKPTSRTKKKAATKPAASKSAAVKAADAKAKQSSKPATKSNAATDRMTQIREASAAKKAAAQKAKTATAATLPIETDSASDETPKLSKAERRRLRKLEKRQKRAA